MSRVWSKEDIAKFLENYVDNEMAAELARRLPTRLGFRLQWAIENNREDAVLRFCLFINSMTKQKDKLAAIDNEIARLTSEPEAPPLE